MDKCKIASTLGIAESCSSGDNFLGYPDIMEFIKIIDHGSGRLQGILAIFPLFSLPPK